MKGQRLGSVEIKLIFPFQITEPCEASWKVGSSGMTKLILPGLGSSHSFSHSELV